MPNNTPREYYTATSPSGTATAAYVDVPSPAGGKLVIVTRTTAVIRTSNGRRRISAKDVVFERYASGIEGQTRDNTTPLVTSCIFIDGPRRNGTVNYNEPNEPYTSIKGAGIKGWGLRIKLSNKDRASDEQYLSVAVETMTDDNLS